MGRKSKNLVKKLEKKVIKKLGQDISYRRMVASNDTSTLDNYGEPLAMSASGSVSGYTDMLEKTIRIVVIDMKIDEDLKSIGRG